MLKAVSLYPNPTEVIYQPSAISLLPFYGSGGEINYKGVFDYGCEVIRVSSLVRIRVS